MPETHAVKKQRFCAGGNIREQHSSKSASLSDTDDCRVRESGRDSSEADRATNSNAPRDK
jgi:hypothetical protein